MDQAAAKLWLASFGAFTNVCCSMYAFTTGHTSVMLDLPATACSIAPRATFDSKPMLRGKPAKSVALVSLLLTRLFSPGSGDRRPTPPPTPVRRRSAPTLHQPGRLWCSARRAGARRWGQFKVSHHGSRGNVVDNVGLFFDSISHQWNSWPRR